MKSLRQLLSRRSRPSGDNGRPKRRTDKRPSNQTTRRLSSQALEQRQMLAGDVNLAHNYWHDHDVNQDLKISPSDALSVINYLGRAGAGEGVAASELSDPFSAQKVDVNDDGQVTPSDALSVINALGRGESAGELVELVLTARDQDDNLLGGPGEVIEVDTGIENSFFLEVAYSDLRGFGSDLGAFTVFPDIGVSEGGVLRPVLRETQQVIIGEEIRSATGGSMTVGREGSAETVEITLNQVGSGDTADLLADALVGWGVPSSDFIITEPNALKGEDGQDLGFQIEYIADEFGNMDIPDLIFTSNFTGNTVPIEFREIAPFNPDGSVNSDAVRFNLDTRSRTFMAENFDQIPGNGTINGAFYNRLNRGSFDLDAGFADIGGVGGAVPGGVPEADDRNDLEEPFDVFRIEVFISDPLSSPLVVDVNPGEGVDPLTLYGTNDPVTPDLILLDVDSRVTISTGQVANTPPVLNTTPLTEQATEDDASRDIDLLAGATDVDNDVLSVSGFNVISGDASGLTQNGSSLSLDPSAYNGLKVNTSEVIVAEYLVTDGQAGSPTQTLTITITGVNDAPVVSPDITETRNEDQAEFTIDLLQNASDPDGDTLDATSIVLNTTAGDSDDSGVEVSDQNNQLTVDPAAYNGLKVGESVSLVYDFTVIDGQGGETDSSVTVTITGVNDAPTAGAAVSVLTNEDANGFNVDLLQNASDPDSDPLSATNIAQSGNDDASGITIDGDNNQLVVDPSAYNGLKEGESVSVVYNFTISDGNGGEVASSATITIEGVNDAPVVSAEITESRSENAPAFNIDLLQNASDPDGDPLAAADIVLNTTDGDSDDSGVTVDGVNSQLTVDPSAYAALNDGESITLVYDFNIVDDKGGTVPTRVTIKINGDTPNLFPEVDGPVEKTLTEDDASSSVDLLEGATDPDEDVLSVSELTLTSGDASGITADGNSLTVDPSAYNSLAQGESEVVIYSYKVIDGEGGSVDQTATVTITGVNDEPTVGDEISVSLSEDADSTSVDLLEGASDPDTSDTLNVSDLTLVGGNNAGITVNGNALDIDPSAYNGLSLGETETITYTYNVTDGNGGTVAQAATISINGANDQPTVDNPVTETVSEDDDPVSIDLLQGASDVDINDVLAISNVTTVSGDSTPFTIENDGTLSFDPNAYNSLAQGDSEVVVLNYDVVDGKGGSVAQSATVTINGANDAPVVGDAIDVTYGEDTGEQSFSLLDGASDPDDGDVLTTENLTVDGDDRGVTIDGDNVTVDTAAYGFLNTGEEVTISFTYQVSDGIVGTNQTATVTIEGLDESIPEVTGPIAVEFNENDDAATVDLLAGASDADGDPLSVTDAAVTSGDARGITIDQDNNRLLVDPSAYADLEDGEQAEAVVSYKITDDQGNTVDQTATVTIIGQTIVASTISGELFVDHIENIQAVINGASPIRNGVMDSDEDALGGITVRLLQVTPDGEVEIEKTLTNAEGEYSFSVLDPGSYIVEYDIPESVQFTGSRRGHIEIGPEGGENEEGPSLNAIGLVGVQQRLNLLVRNYLARGIANTNDEGGVGVGCFEFNTSGDQEMFVAEQGVDIQFAQVALNDARDAALLTILGNNDEVLSARLTLDQFVVTGDGEGVCVFENLEDIDFVADTAELVVEEFANYRDAIDRVLAENN